jgi:hypothetical protein
VRLAFHDATGSGGSNGCIDFSCSSNRGLEEVVQQLDEIYPQFSAIISKADFWVRIPYKYCILTQINCVRYSQPMLLSSMHLLQALIMIRVILTARQVLYYSLLDMDGGTTSFATIAEPCPKRTTRGNKHLVSSVTGLE